jgi:predicted nucleic acid-binding protein
MADSFVAADASPLIGLATAGAFHLLKELFGRVTVTPAVGSFVMP